MNSVTLRPARLEPAYQVENRRGLENGHAMFDLQPALGTVDAAFHISARDQNQPIVAPGVLFYTVNHEVTTHMSEENLGSVAAVFEATNRAKGLLLREEDEDLGVTRPTQEAVTRMEAFLSAAARQNPALVAPNVNDDGDKGLSLSWSSDRRTVILTISRDPGAYPRLLFWCQEESGAFLPNTVPALSDRLGSLLAL